MANKFIVVLNKNYEASQLLSALGHVTAGISGNTGQSASMNFIVYIDKSGQKYPNISEWPFIILRGSGTHIKRFRNDLLEVGMPYSCYLNTMISGGSAAQVAATKEKTTDELEILALATFGEVSQLDFFTKKFSLWH